MLNRFSTKTLLVIIAVLILAGGFLVITAASSLVSEMPTLVDSQYGVWTEASSYMPQYSFRVAFETAKWLLSSQGIVPKLVHRTIANCTMRQTGGRASPDPDWSTVMTNTVLGNLTYELYELRYKGTLQFMTYAGPRNVMPKNFYTVFQVDNIGTCRSDAEKVLSTLQVVPTQNTTPSP